MRIKNLIAERDPFILISAEQKITFLEIQAVITIFAGDKISLMKVGPWNLGLKRAKLAEKWNRKVVFASIIQRTPFVGIPAVSAINNIRPVFVVYAQ